MDLACWYSHQVLQRYLAADFASGVMHLCVSRAIGYRLTLTTTTTSGVVQTPAMSVATSSHKTSLPATTLVPSIKWPSTRLSIAGPDPDLRLHTSIYLDSTEALPTIESWLHTFSNYHGVFGHKLDDMNKNGFPQGNPTYLSIHSHALCGLDHTWAMLLHNDAGNLCFWKMRNVLFCLQLVVFKSPRTFL